MLLPVRDARGLTRLDYAVRFRNPADLTVTRGDDGRYSYSVEVRVRVFTPEKQLIFTQQKSVSDSFGQRRLDEIKQRPFGYEGILPLPPGKYHLDFLVTDWAKQVGFNAHRDVTIPETDAKHLELPAILAFSAATRVDQAKDGTIPFAMAGLRFSPLEMTPLVFNPDQTLQVAYQIWAPPQDPRANAGQNLVVDYALGKPTVTGTAAVLKDTVDMGAFTSSGTLVNGKRIPLADKPDGDYLLTVSVSHSGTLQKAYAPMSFQILSDAPVALPWDVDEPAIDADMARGILDQQRALCYLAQGRLAEARPWFRLALRKDRGNDVARSHLVQAYYTLKAYPAVVSLFEDVGVTNDTDAATLAQIAGSLVKTGNAAKAVSLLQDAIRSRPENGPLYLALADCYEQMGNHQEGLEMLGKGKALLRTDSPAK